MSKKLIYLMFVVLVLVPAGTNVAFGGIVIVRPVASSVDDAEEEKVGGDLNIPNSDLELVFDHLPTAADEEQVVGIRFIDIRIPKGSTIVSASVQFSCDDNNNDYHVGDAHLIIEGELNPNPDGFKNIDFNITARARTTASVQWDPPRWTSKHQESPGERTSDISSIIQELVDQEGWVAGNALVLIFSNNPTNRSVGIREAESIEGAGESIEQIPTLTIEFTAKSAMEPNPADGAVTTDSMVNLSWMPGDTAATHDLYFGESFADVNNGTGGPIASGLTNAIQLVGLALPGVPYPGGLVPGTTYYWRIEEVEADGTTIHKGDVWSFTILPQTALDPYPPDRAKYADPDTVLSWTGGLGSITHHMYFGDNFADVNDGAGSTDKGPLLSTTYTPGPLAKGTTYYWRVDEFAADGTHRGDIWSFRTVSDIPITDPNLIGWWKFDEGYGDIAIDSSGHGNDGTLLTESWYWPIPPRVPGLWGDALDLTGDSYVQLPLGILGADVGSVSMWIKTTQDTRGHMFLGSQNSDGDGWGGTDNHELHLSMENTGDIELRLDSDGKTDSSIQTSDTVNDDTWHHVAATWAIGGDVTMYLDGDVVGTSSHNGSTFSFTGSLRLGRGGKAARFYSGLLEDIRLYDRELNQQEVRETMAGDPLLAKGPNPGDELTVDILEATPLTWKKGELAIEHAVYFGADLDAVRGADESDTTDIYRGRQSTTSYTPPEVEFSGGPYYWRVDEHNSDGTVSDGSVWSFTVADYLVIDDFESYNDIEPPEPESNRIYETWIDGYVEPPEVPTNGSTIGYVEAFQPSMETEIVHSGEQSVPFTYNNSLVAYSEVTVNVANLVIGSDWTRYGVKSLSLWFSGDVNNVPEQMYVKLNGVKVLYDSDAGNLSKSSWQPWNTNLTDFAGVDLGNVTELSIGFERSGFTGGTGTVLFDDIRLYPYERQWITPAEPSQAGLAAHYEFEGTTNDSSGNGLHGTAMGSPTFVAGKVGQAIELRGLNDYVEITGYKGILGPNAFSITAWIKSTFIGDDTQEIVYYGTHSDGQRCEFRVHTNGHIRMGAGGGQVEGLTAVTDGGWHHVAATIIENATNSSSDVRIYVDGQDDTQESTDPDAFNLVADWDVTIGYRPSQNDRFFDGQIDDVRIYDRVLSQEEIAWLAGRTKPFDKPF